MIQEQRLAEKQADSPGGAALGARAGGEEKGSRAITVNKRHSVCSKEKKRHGIRSRDAVTSGWLLRQGPECLSSADLHRAREKQTASFTLFCKDAAGESMGRGGESVHVAVVPKDKKDRFVLHSQASGVIISGDKTGNLRPFTAVM